MTMNMSSRDDELALAINAALRQFKAALQEMKADPGPTANASIIGSIKEAFSDDPRTALFTNLGNLIYELEACRRHLRQLGCEKVADSHLDQPGPTYFYVLAKKGQKDVGLRINATNQQLEDGVHTYLAKVFDLADCVDAKDPKTVSTPALVRVEQQWVKVRVSNGACVVI